MTTRNTARGLGNRLRQLRGEAGITQEELAERVSVHPTYIAKIEGGSRLPSLELLYGLAEALHVSAADVVRAVEHTPPTASHDHLIDEVLTHLRDCGPRERIFVRDFVLLMKKHCESQD